MRDIVRMLAQRCPITIVSGRGPAGRGGFPWDSTQWAMLGSHGFDIRGQVGSAIEREVGTEYLPVLDATEAMLRERLAGIEGILVERKRFTIATHVRRVSEVEWPAVEAVVEAVGRAHPTLKKEGGKAVFELRPTFEWDKGAAVLWLLDALGLPRAVPIHLGDDLTDETVFEAIRDRGVGIVVADKDRPTSAQFALHDTRRSGGLSHHANRPVGGLAMSARGTACGFRGAMERGSTPATRTSPVSLLPADFECSYG